jgi:hypothetical protein
LFSVFGAMRSRSALSVLWVGALVALAVPAVANADFGLKEFDVTFGQEGGGSATQAGSHPAEMATNFTLNYIALPGEPDLSYPDGSLKDLEVEMPIGFAGNPSVVPTCPHALFLRLEEAKSSRCPDDTAIGVAEVQIFVPSAGGGTQRPVFNLDPPPGFAAEFGFLAGAVPVTIDARLQPAKPYRVIVSSTNVGQPVDFFGARVRVWGNPASPAHDKVRGKCAILGGSCPSAVAEKAFLTLPRGCGGPDSASYRATSWQDPLAQPLFGESETPLELSECESLGFGPTIDAQPTSTSAESPSGFDFDLNVSDPGLSEPDGTADSDIKKTVVTLPEGITTNPAAAAGLGACTQAQYESETLNSEAGTGCPESAKVGTVEVETPLLEEPDESLRVLHGAIYVAKQHDNEFDSLLALDMVIKDPELGILVRAAGKVEPDPATGRLRTTFDDLPQVPFSHFHLHIREGQRAPLITPPTCGTFNTEADLYPYARPDSPLHETASFTISAGSNGRPCAQSVAGLPHAPGFNAGTLDPKAGSYSPFVLNLNREDGSQRFSAVSTTLPKGLIGKLAGIPYCSEADIARAQARSGEGQGALELASPSCPAASEVGTVTVGAGAGPQPLYVSGHAYLAGPYRGAPLSLEVITPAIAGPFDLGTVAIRTALHVDPVSTQVSAVSDPVPTILHGLPLDVRSIALETGRPQFTLNPTSCEPKQIVGSVTSPLGSSAPLNQYFQASDCGALQFEPKLSLRLKGKTERAGFPALHAVYLPRGGDANLNDMVVRFPRSEFVEQGHFRTICTRVQWAMGAGGGTSCPKGSIYGQIRAITPLLDQPLEGPVYLRSSSHNLPDVVFALRGQVSAEVAVRIDSVKGGLRASIADAPDVPIAKVTLDMQGGGKGLFVNSRDICAQTYRAAVQLAAQNGATDQLRPPLRAGCPKRHASPRRG